MNNECMCLYACLSVCICVLCVSWYQIILCDRCHFAIATSMTVIWSMMTFFCTQILKKRRVCPMLARATAFLNFIRSYIATVCRRTDKFFVRCSNIKWAKQEQKKKLKHLTISSAYHMMCTQN